jgi:hypothetical protein
MKAVRRGAAVRKLSPVVGDPLIIGKKENQRTVPSEPARERRADRWPN